LNRRRFLQTTAALPLASSTVGDLIASAKAEASPFDRSIVRQLARDAASKPYKASDETLPDNLKNLDYDHYREIRFLPERALWRSEKLPFQVQFFHRGFFYAPRIDIYEVANGQATKIAYRPDDFSFGSNHAPSSDTDLGFAGFRIHAPINKPDYYDEVCVFLGASYFRAVAKGEIYGLSARGLAINTGEAKGEEFPKFKTRSRLLMPIPSSCTPCSTAKVLPRLIVSRSDLAIPRCSTWNLPSIRASISTMLA
jgi:glucans biosynthesis protein